MTEEKITVDLNVEDAQIIRNYLITGVLQAGLVPLRKINKTLQELEDKQRAKEVLKDAESVEIKEGEGEDAEIQ